MSRNGSNNETAVGMTRFFFGIVKYKKVAAKAISTAMGPMFPN
ncbi:MAG: hypothetical protein OSJ43_02845 [Oscillospiraceae bacterium]|nr:hypothetical protein [Oscillospiraceae bacterium]